MIEDPSLLVSDIILLGEWFPTLRRIFCFDLRR